MNETLSSAEIYQYFSPLAKNTWPNITVVEKIASTHEALMASSIDTHILLAKEQRAGIGRHQRSWISAKEALLGSWIWESTPDHPISTLSLVIGVSVLQALPEYDITLKWPNDLIKDGNKLGGILVNAKVTPHGNTQFVMSLGLNVKGAPDNLAASELSSSIPKTLLWANIFNQLSINLILWEKDGFTPFYHEWNQVDALKEKNIDFYQGEECYSGAYHGIDANTGALKVRLSDQQIHHFYSAEIACIREHIKEKI